MKKKRIQIDVKGKITMLQTSFMLTTRSGLSEGETYSLRLWEFYYLSFSCNTGKQTGAVIIISTITLFFVPLLLTLSLITYICLFFEHLSYSTTQTQFLRDEKARFNLLN